MCTEAEIRVIIKEELSPFMRRQREFEQRAKKSILKTSEEVKACTKAVGEVCSYSHDAKVSSEHTIKLVSNLIRKVDENHQDYRNQSKEIETIKIKQAKLEGRKEGATAVTVAAWTFIITVVGLGIAWVKK